MGRELEGRQVQDKEFCAGGLEGSVNTCLVFTKPRVQFPMLEEKGIDGGVEGKLQHLPLRWLKLTDQVVRHD